MNAERGERAEPPGRSAEADPDLRREVESLLDAPATGSDTVEIAHVLFTDLVGYSLLPMDRQKEYLAQLQEIVRESPRFRAAEKAGGVISLPTGDGMALAFSGDPLAPVQCAVEVAAALKNLPHLKLRMGIHGGPVYRISDVNARANVAGGGINTAQRVMDCGDAGHILVSKPVADMLLQFSQWAPHVTDFGEVTVKHGVKVHIYNLATGDVGNAARPARLKAAPLKPRTGFKPRMAIAVAGLILVAAPVWWFASGRWGAGAAPDAASIAVLPFADLSKEKDQAYFADGLAEELLNTLTRVPGLRVIGRTSSFQFKEGVGDFHTIRDKLKVASILQGSVRKQGTRARISVELIKTSDGFELWSDSFDRDMTDILAVQQDIAGAVTGKLKLTVLDHSQPPAAAGTNGAAYDAYLQALYLGKQGSRDSLEKAAALYERSLQLDPGSARVWAALGENRFDQAQENYIPRDEGYRKSREALDRAIALDAKLASPWSTLAWIAMYHDWNWTAAASYSQKALALDPGSTIPINTAATLALVLGNREEALALYRRAIALDPLSPAKLTNAGIVLYYSGRYAEAEDYVKKAMGLSPDRDDLHLYVSLIRLAQGKAREALDEAGREKNAGHRLFGMALAQYALGDKTGSDDSLTKLIAGFTADSPCLIGEIYAYRGDKDRAFEWLERAFDSRDSDLTDIKGNPMLRNVERDPRYAALLKKIGLPL